MMQSTMMTTPMIGRTDRKVFWLVFLGSMFVLTLMISLVAKGGIAVAAALPVPFTVQAPTLRGSNFKLYPGISSSDNSTPVGINQMDCSITNLAIVKKVDLPIAGTITMTLSSGNGATSTINGLTIDVASLGANSANFQNLSLNTNTGGLNLNSPAMTLNNATINSPYLLVNNITMPNLSLSITRG